MRAEANANLPLGDQQQPRRQQERQVRQAAVAFERWTAQLGWSGAQAAWRLGVHPRTLQHWQCRWQEDHLAAAERGRPRHLADAITRSAVVDVIEELGPSVGVPTLKTMFPTVVCSELGTCCRAYQRSLYIASADEACHLMWPVPGRVWATDFTEPPQPIDGLFRYVLLVRDLAASRQLLAMATKTTEARVAVAALRELFLQWGAPLVVKADNGTFAADLFRNLLLDFMVTPLFSPPYLPQYNGAIEAGNGSLKAHARQEALRHGRTIWTSDDLEVACASPNTFARPWGSTGPSPDQRWDSRRPITAAERHRFTTTLTAMKTQVIAEFGLRPSDLTRRAVRADVDRTATRRALQSLGYLFVLGGPIRPPLKSENCHFIT